GVHAPAAGLHRARAGAADRPDGGDVPQLPGSGRVEVDDMDPARAHRLEAARHDHGVVGVHGLVVEVASQQPHHIAATDVDRRVEVERTRHRVPFVDGIPCPSTLTASRNDRATPLNDASMTWCPFLPVSERMCSVIPAANANPRQNSSASWGSNVPIHSATGSTSYTRNGRPERSSATWTSASSRGTIADANRRTPALSPTASLNAVPSTMPTSSTVWWRSTSRSPLGATERSKPACLPSCSSMWSRNGIPVDAVALPDPSISSTTSTVVSFVARCCSDDLVMRAHLLFRPTPPGARRG